MDTERLQQAVQRGDLATANKVCDAALLNDSHDVFALYWKGQLLRMSGDAATAEYWLGRSLHEAQEANDADAIGIVALALGIVLQELGNLPRAVDVLSAAADENPPNEPAMRNSLGMTYRRFEKEEAALQEYDRGLRVELRQAVQLGRELRLWGVKEEEDGKEHLWWDERFAEAVAKILVERKTAALVLGNVASILLDLGQPDRAADALYRSVALGDPGGGAAGLLQQMGRAVAESDLNAAVDRNIEVLLNTAIEIASSHNS